jgi:tetratricopeptide (TPR) repeat protein
MHGWRKLLVVAVVALVPSGCARLGFDRTSDIVFPRLDSAREQFYYAAQYDEQTLVGKGPERRDVRLERIIAAYQTVLDHFPNDRLYAPLALAGIGNCYFRMGDYPKAIRVFKDTKRRYPNYPFVHAQAEWRIGESLQQMGKAEEAKESYRRVIDTFRHSKNDRIQLIVTICKSRYIPPSIPGRTP